MPETNQNFDRSIAGLGNGRAVEGLSESAVRGAIFHEGTMHLRFPAARLRPSEKRALNAK